MASRSGWPIRRYRLGEEPRDEGAYLTAEERVAVMWALAREGWALAGRRLPNYDRRSIPSRLYRAGEPRQDG